MSAQSVVGRKALEVVVCLQDSVVDVVHVRLGADVQQVKAGSTEDCQIPLPAGILGAGVESVVVAELGLGGAQVASAIVAGATMRALGTLESARLDIGPMRLHVREFVDAKPIPRPVFTGEKKIFGVIAASVVAHLAALFVLFAIPPDAHGLSTSTEYYMMRNHAAAVKPAEEPKPEERTGKDNGNEASNENNDAQAHDGDAGKQGQNKDGKTEMHVRGSAPTIHIGMGDPRVRARNAGALAFMNERSFSLVTDGDDQTFGKHYDDRVGSDPSGNDPGGTGTEWASSYDGDKTGGCRPGMYCGPGTIGPGTYHTHSKDPGYKIDGPPGVKTHDPKHPVPQIHTKIEVEGDDGLDAEIVRKEIQKHRAAVAYCYEKQLTVNPDLSGNVTLQFTIGPDGSMEVVSIKSATIGSKEVTACVQAEAMTWKFPPSKHRTHVSYPFEFRVAG